MKLRNLFLLFTLCTLFTVSFSSCSDDDEKDEVRVPSVVVTNLSFTDTDEEVLKIGGTLSWTLPSSETDVTGYVIYLGGSATDKATKLGEVAVGKNSFDISAGTTYNTNLIVVAKNVVGESENMASIVVQDINVDVPEPQPQTIGYYILNRGNFNANNASISYYDLATDKLTPNYYQSVNGKGLGSDAEQMFVYGSKIYVSVTSSNRLVVLDKQGKEIKEFTPKNSAGETMNPRCFTALDGKVYVSYYYGSSVAVLDTTSLELEKEISLGMATTTDKDGNEVKSSRYPEQLAAANGKIYVALSEYGKGKTVGVIDPATAKLEKEIEVIVNPCNLAASSKGDVYVVSMGDYGDIKNTVQRIDASDKVSVIGNGSKMSLVNDKLYVVYAQWGAPAPSFMKYDALTGAVESQNLITDGTTLANPNSIDVDPITGKIYISNAAYGETASMYVFTPEGKKDGEPFDTGGYDTQKVCFIAQ